jgi:hypothetical protein
LYEKTIQKHNFTNGNFEKNTPKKGEMGFQIKENGNSVIFYRIRNNKEENNIACEVCGTDFSIDKSFELHHIDNDSTNNMEENFLWCCNSCHKKEHYKMNRRKVFEKGIPTKLSKIISIEYSDTEMVYDIEMEAPAHNFISESGLVTSNSHAYSVAGDSLYGAYLKAKYPYEFYEVFLNMLEEDGDKDRLAKTKEEAEKGFGIKFPNYQFGQDNRTIKLDKEKGIISSSLKSLKSFNSQIGEFLYSMSDKEYTGFLDFLVQAEELGSVSSKFEKLIMMGYFVRFGGAKKLLTIWNEFRTGKNKYTNKLTQKSKDKRLLELQLLEKNTPDEEISYAEQIKSDIEITGKISRTYPNINKMIAHVFEINDGQGKYAPRLEVRSLNTGKSASIKINKKIFGNNPIKTGDIIICKKLKKEPALKYENGNYVKQEGVFNRWLLEYEIVDDIDKLIKK